MVADQQIARSRSSTSPTPPTGGPPATPGCGGTRSPPASTTPSRTAAPAALVAGVDNTNDRGSDSDRFFRSSATEVLAAWLHAAALGHRGIDDLLDWMRHPDDPTPTRILEDHPHHADPSAVLNLTTHLDTRASKTTSGVLRYLALALNSVATADGRALCTPTPDDPDGFDMDRHHRERRHRVPAGRPQPDRPRPTTAQPVRRRDVHGRRDRRPPATRAAAAGAVHRRARRTPLRRHRARTCRTSPARNANTASGSSTPCNPPARKKPSTARTPPPSATPPASPSSAASTSTSPRNCPTAPAPPPSSPPPAAPPAAPNTPNARTPSPSPTSRTSPTATPSSSPADCHRSSGTPPPCTTKRRLHRRIRREETQVTRPGRRRQRGQPQPRPTAGPDARNADSRMPIGQEMP